jgi:hypothetical protein
VAEYPRDALITQTCASIFGLIGFSGKPGREAELLAYTASLLYWAEFAGAKVGAERWQLVSNYAKQFFPEASIAFADIHAVLAHTMAGNTESLHPLLPKQQDPFPI